MLIFEYPEYCMASVVKLCGSDNGLIDSLNLFLGTFSSINGNNRIPLPVFGMRSHVLSQFKGPGWLEF